MQVVCAEDTPPASLSPASCLFPPCPACLSAEDHGVFQIPTDACPSTFTGFATERYRELAAAGRVSKLWSGGLGNVS